MGLFSENPCNCRTTYILISKPSAVKCGNIDSVTKTTYDIPIRQPERRVMPNTKDQVHLCVHCLLGTVIFMNITQDAEMTLVQLWGALPQNTKERKSISSFKRQIKNMYINAFSN